MLRDMAIPDILLFKQYLQDIYDSFDQETEENQLIIKEFII